jgi:hypothetical protein
LNHDFAGVDKGIDGREERAEAIVRVRLHPTCDRAQLVEQIHAPQEYHAPFDRAGAWDTIPMPLEM